MGRMSQLCTLCPTVQQHDVALTSGLGWNSKYCNIQHCIPNIYVSKKWNIPLEHLRIMIVGVCIQSSSYCLPLTVPKAVGPRAHSALPRYMIHRYLWYLLYRCAVVPLYRLHGTHSYIHTIRPGRFSRLFRHTPESGNCVSHFDWFQSKRLLGCVSHSNFFFTPNIICPNRDHCTGPAQIPITGCKKKRKKEDTKK